jgi:hypothetical protein
MEKRGITVQVLRDFMLNSIWDIKLQDIHFWGMSLRSCRSADVEENVLNSVPWYYYPVVDLSSPNFPVDSDEGVAWSVVSILHTAYTSSVISYGL